MKTAIVIPARYQSSRLPGKPLTMLRGKPMIIRTYGQCLKAFPAEQIYVATDDQRISKVCEEQGIKVLMTSTECRTGTDRVAECSRHLDADQFINVQGDEPLFNPKDLEKLIEAAKAFPGEVLNGYCLLEEDNLFYSGQVPKVVFRPDGRLLYMSRAPIPTNKNQSFVKAWRQVCAYVFPRSALASYVEKGHKTMLEEIEDIEILRFLELGWDVRMIKLSNKSVPVDNPEDIAKVERLIRERGL
jgi:3-deoxy-manno-octulosonate cytidylyltransferase (CMP-KDO synthetase)